MQYYLTILLLFSTLIATASAEESRFIIQRNVPLFNVQKKVFPIKQLPALTQSVPAETNDYIIQNLDSSHPVNMETLTGETLFLDLFLTRFADKGSVTISLEPNFTPDTHISSDIYLAPLWLQAGTSTSKSKLYYVKTYELLLKTDININFNDKW